MRFKTLAQLVRQNKDVPLSGEDISKICDGKVIVMSYAQLGEIYKSGGSILSEFKPEFNYCIVLLYQLNGPGGVGHWVSVIYNEDNHTIMFFNSYGLPVDAEISLMTHGETYLSKLLYATGLPIQANPHCYQKFKGDTSTCGMHAAIRCVFNELTNEEYHRAMKLTNHGLLKDYDSLVSLMCIVPLKYNIPQ